MLKYRLSKQRDVIIAKGECPLEIKDNLLLDFDIAGVILAEGEDLNGAADIATFSSDTVLAVAHVVNYKTTPAWDKEVLRISSGRAVDHVIEFEDVNRLVSAMELRPVVHTVFDFERARREAS
ncbi:hypothetical protein C8Q80DRAFT_1274192 [Daedaleopsis nitida]|nr:hypothetical protein C8Q80DRAFT_1274192 [Daedaleopsis nitida]